MSKRILSRHENVTICRTDIGSDQMKLVVAPVAQARPDALAGEAYRQIAAIVQSSGMEIVHERIFGPLANRAAILAARAAAAPSLTGQPVTFIDGKSPAGLGLSGIQIHAVSSGEQAAGPWTIRDSAGNPAGRGWRVGDVKFMLLHGVHGRDDARPSAAPQQATLMFDRAAELLASQGTDYRSVARTWIYLDDILSWYGPFNAARNERYSAFGLMSGAVTDIHGRIILPASTGIEGRNPAGSACAMDVLSISGPCEAARIAQMTNARQKDAFKYGSAFSRGTAIDTGDAKIIEISGTAAIDEAGVSLFPGDVRAQIQKTFDVVDALLAQQNAGLKDICSATVFLKRPGDLEIYREESVRRGLADMPAVLVTADVCRDELLFEMDGVAVAGMER